MKSRSDAILKAIAVMKLLKGIALVAIACGALSLVRRDIAHGIHGWIDELAPSGRFLRHTIARIAELDPHTLELVAIGGFIYASVFLVEGVGLLLKKTWAEYMTTGVTTSFIPLEIYELVERPSPIKVAMIVLNIGIVIYLVWRLRHDRHWPFRNR